VAELGEKKGAENVHTNLLSRLMKFSYNEILRVETVQHLGVLDSYNDYNPPQCMVDKYVKNIMHHFLYEKYTTRIKSHLQDGSRGKQATYGTHTFYAALHHQVEAENEIDAEESD